MQYYVSPAGADTNAAVMARPFGTLAKVANVLVPGDTCWLRGGVYREVLRTIR